MKSIKHLNKLVTATGIIVALISQSAFAHESRIITNENGDQIRITAGNQPEPVFAGQLSRTDLFLNQLDNDGNSTPVDVSDGASIEDLKTYVLFLKEEVHVDSLKDPAVIKSMELHDIEQVRGTDNRYQSPIIYTHPGAYGFHFEGTIVTNDGSQFEIDEFFVCGGGSLADPREDGSVPAFGCVKEPISFPGKLKKGKHKNKK